MTRLRVFDPLSKDPFDELFSGFFRPVRADMPATPDIKIDVEENDRQFIVKAELPGMKKEDIDVRISGDTVSISGTVKEERTQKDNGKVLMSERYYGSVERSFSLGTDVDETEAQARYEEGVLQLTLPKKATSQTKRLSIA